ncbi:MAG: hypothetical protein CM1200mP14_09760 [Gammaproteobacteria bacterium]|nr:MAG: hypothetical protein CM1200mP14_09760 [Gammaproteobacteria bacterium]
MSPGVIDYVVDTDLNFTTRFVIPAGDPNYEVKHQRPFEEDTYLPSLGPHMHLRGKAMRYELEYPDGKMETLLWVPDYDFNWQFLYEYEEPSSFRGSKLHMTWWFDNSEGIPKNPDPTAEVVYGARLRMRWQMPVSTLLQQPPKGIVVGEKIPEELLRAAEAREPQTQAENLSPKGSGVRM